MGLSLTNSLNDLFSRNVCFLLNCQKVELVDLLTLNLIGSLQQPTKIHRVWRVVWWNDSKNPTVVWEQRTWSTFFGAKSNPIFVRKEHTTRRTVLSWPHYNCVHSVSLPISDLDPMGSKCHLREDTDSWPHFSWKCCWLLVGRN